LAQTKISWECAVKNLTESDKADLLRVLAERGIAFDSTGKGVAHKHNATESGKPLPPFKFNLCTADIRPEGKLLKEDISLISRELLRYLRQQKDWEFMGLSGIPRVAEPFVEEIQHLSYHENGVSLSRVVILKSETGFAPYRTRGNISPHLLWGVDDLIQYGLTKTPALDAWEHLGFNVRNILVVLNYERGGPELLSRERRVRVHALATVREVASFAEAENIWSEEQVAIVREYLRTP